MEQRYVTLSADEANETYGYLTTTGRRSGTPHTIEIWFVVITGRTTIYLMSGGRERSDWVRNLRANPSVHFRIAATTYSGIARPIEGTPEEDEAPKALAAKYYVWEGGELPNDWSRTALPIAIDLSSIVVDAP